MRINKSSFMVTNNIQPETPSESYFADQVIHMIIIFLSPKIYSMCTYLLCQLSLTNIETVNAVIASILNFIY